ncbi:flp pilus assembly protein tadD [Vibrio ishigakensis]|uniref:Flp pilus assembly protein tadD n=1 Tax=Vibrio ishigakensis TaxID=1481914 RepID=A0A0B8P7C6_9VIBR|nr:SPOR domain-containing protein [Vibrio ishigakensis]GAM58824.1 flp pilus assembly protein tadD [Vibrio ishigakensis]
MKKIILIVVLVLSGCASNSQNQEQQNIEQLTVSNNYSGLVDIYKTKVVENESDWDSQLKLSEAYLNNSDVESADFYISRVLELSPNPPAQAHLIKGKINAKNFLFDDAIEQYSKAIGLGLNSGELYMHRGIALAQTKKYETAIDSFNLARLRGYDETAVKNNIAMVHIYEGDFQAAVDILLPVYEQDTSNNKVSSNLKLSLMKLEGQEQNDITETTDSGLIEPEIENVAQIEEVSAVTAEEFFEAKEPINQLKNTGRKYHIQLGAYDNMAEALEKRTELIDTELPIAIRPVDLGDSGTWYRLLVGDFNTYRQARNFARENNAVLENHDYFIQVIN